MTFSKPLRVMSLLLSIFGNMSFFNRGVLYMSLVKTLDELKENLDDKNIDRKEFVKKLEYAIDKARWLTTFANDSQTFEDIITLVAFYTADGDKHATELLRTIIKRYISITKGLDSNDVRYFRELLFQYFIK